VTPEEARDFIRANTAQSAPPLLPEITLWLTDDITPLWHLTEDTLAKTGIEPPFWAFAWPGGQAVARHVLDNPDLVAGKRVLDICAGSGLCGIAAMRAGAAHVTAADLDPLSAVAIAMNAKTANVTIVTTTDDLLTAEPAGWDVVLAGDVCYERGLADEITPWLRDAARNGALVLMGDPGRAYLPERGLEKVTEYDVPVPPQVEADPIKRTIVWQLR
jgi:predicted nicotinamide N-methyase